MSNFKLEFKLKQHTPIIHFQHDQNGATLRATELKPKLDKFLKEKRPDLPFGEHGELNYKVKIKAQNIKSSHIESPPNRPGGRARQFPNFFANMGDGEDKLFTFTNEIIEVVFFTFNNEIRRAVEDNFANFLMLTNFGSRQSKGFGSFYIDQSDDNYKDISLSYYFDVNSDKMREIFDHIQLLYKTLRSGLNEIRGGGKCIFYFKSLMFLYAKKKLEIQWDKKSIKEEFFFRNLNEQIINHNNEDIIDYSSNNRKLMKDLLGLSSSEQWKSYRATIEKENTEIDRFKSPLFFKPIATNTGYRIYIGFEEIPNEMLDTEFQIKNRGQHFPLRTPAKFDIADFLKFAFTVDISNHVDSKFHSSNEFMVLSKIFRQLAQQVEVIND